MFKKKLLILFYVLVAVIMFRIPVFAGEDQLPDKPTTNIYVQDYAKLLTTTEIQKLVAESTSLNTQKGIQFAILTVKVLPDGYDLESYSNEVFKKWGIGDKETNKGLLFVYVTGSDKIRLEVGYGLEGDIPDITAKSILQQVHPLLREKKYSGALNMLYPLISDAKLQTAQTPKKSIFTIPNLIVVIALLLGICGGIFEKPNRHHRDYDGHGDPHGYNGGGYDGSSGGGGFGGGFGGGGGGFGGGSSGGGGASD